MTTGRTYRSLRIDRLQPPKSPIHGTLTAQSSIDAIALSKKEPLKESQSSRDMPCFSKSPRMGDLGGESSQP